MCNVPSDECPVKNSGCILSMNMASLYSGCDIQYVSLGQEPLEMWCNTGHNKMVFVLPEPGLSEEYSACNELAGVFVSKPVLKSLTVCYSLGIGKPELISVFIWRGIE